MPRIIVKMLSTGTNKKGKPTGTFRTTTKNNKTKPDKLAQKHYDRLAFNSETGKSGMHVLFKETKV